MCISFYSSEIYITVLLHVYLKIIIIIIVIITDNEAYRMNGFCGYVAAVCDTVVLDDVCTSVFLSLLYNYCYIDSGD